MSKDRAAPFSRKHRRYWLPVTGGMVAIGLLNIGIGLCSYPADRAPPQRILPHLPQRDAAVDAPGTLGPSELPADVMRAFAVKYPRTIPSGATLVTPPGASEPRYVIGFPPGDARHHATFRPDGAFVDED